MVKRLLFLFILGALGALVLRGFVIEKIYIASPSMEPTLKVGEEFWVDKVTYILRKPVRGEIVMLESPVDEDKDVIKRVIGLPGDIIEMKDKSVYLNGKLLEEPYVQFTRPDEKLVGDQIGKIEIPNNSYFILGDNRDASHDSRDWGLDKGKKGVLFVPMEIIKGRVIVNK